MLLNHRFIVDQDETYCDRCGDPRSSSRVCPGAPETQVSLTDSTKMPPPIPNDKPSSWQLVIKDMQAREDYGRKKYGTPLQPGNGRDSLVDAYQEALDLVVYLRNEIEERRNRTASKE